MTDLRLEGIAVTVGGTRVLRDVDLHVPAGSCTAVLGPSGAGKTTLLRAMAGLQPVDAGRLLLDTRDVTTVPAHQRRIGVVFQEPRLFPHRSVRDNVAFGLEVAGVDAATRRDAADALLARVGLADLGARTVEGLSGGEQQRVNLARALAVDPDVLLLDEPLSSVDPVRRDELRSVIAEVTADRTTVHVTHDRAEAAELGDRVAVLLDGVIEQHDEPSTVFEQPATARVAELLGGTVLVGEARSGRFDVAGGSIPVVGSDGPATLAVRPEHVRLGSGPLTGVVSSATYRGGHVRLLLDIGSDRPLAADVAPDEALPAGAETTFDLAAVWRLPSPEIPEPPRAD